MTLNYPQEVIFLNSINTANKLGDIKIDFDEDVTSKYLGAVKDIANLDDTSICSSDYDDCLKIREFFKENKAVIKMAKNNFLVVNPKELTVKTRVANKLLDEKRIGIILEANYLFSLYLMTKYNDNLLSNTQDLLEKMKAIKEEVDHFYIRITDNLSYNDRKAIIKTLINRDCYSCNNGSCQISNNEKGTSGNECYDWDNPIYIGKSHFFGIKDIHKLKYPKGLQ